MTARFLLVGQNPGKFRGEPLAGRVGRRLAALAGISLDEYLATFDRVNVIDRDLRGLPWPQEDARTSAAMIRRRFVRYEAVVVLGRLAAISFGAPGEYRPLYWYSFGYRYGPQARLATMPHPSGLNRWWNDPRNVRRARRFLRKLVRS